MRDEFEAKGLCFLVHADAAWGGYFASMIRERTGPIGRGPKEEPSRDFVPTETLRPSTVRQFEALARTDSITIDPHKAGYIPYPAGGLCYRDGRMRYLVTWSAPYLQQSDTGESIGVYGVEGRYISSFASNAEWVLTTCLAVNLVRPQSRPICTIK
jgi:glutamate/tyrosine decarboxylase-like PLP-dependent enzyme